MDKIDKLIGRIATTSCSGKKIISLNMHGESRLKEEIYKLLEHKELTELIQDYNDKEPSDLATEIINLLKK